MKMTIRKLRKEESNIYRKIRLDALKKFPESFGSTYKEQVVLKKLYFERVIEEKSSAGAMVGAFEDKELVGICGIIYNVERDEGEIVQLYVRKEFQGLNLGKSLIEGVISLSPEIKKFTLGVKRNNLSAVRIYRRIGFEEIKGPEKERNDTIHMIYRKKR